MISVKKENILKLKKDKTGYIKIVILLLFLVIIGGLLANPLYAILNPPTKLILENKLSDEYDIVSIKYWDTEKGIMCFESFDDPQVVNDIYSLVCNIEIKHQLWKGKVDGLAISKNQTCLIGFEGAKGIQTIYIYGGKYLEFSEESFERDRREISNEELFDYLEGLSSEIDYELVNKKSYFK